MVLVHLEFLVVYPGISAVHGNVYWYISNNAHPVLARIFYQYFPLNDELILGEFTEDYLIFPFKPFHVIETFFYSHEQSIIFKPKAVFFAKILVFCFFHVFIKAIEIGLFQHIESVQIYFFVIDIALIFKPLNG